MANSSKKKSGLQRGESKAAFLFCTPAVVLALVFIILPFAMSVVYSFTNKQLIPKVGMETAFVGLKNYIEIFTSKVTVLSFKNTFLYALIVVAFGIGDRNRACGFCKPEDQRRTGVPTDLFQSAGCNDDCSGSYLGIHFFLQIQRIIKFVSGSAAYCTSEVASGSASGTSVSGNYVYLAESWYADVDHFKWSAVHFRRTI